MRVCAFSIPLALASLVGLCAAGCGGGAPGLARGSVHGQVKFAGEPVAEGTISFTPIGTTPGGPAGGRIENGVYKLEGPAGPVVGKHRVEITALRKTGQKIPAVPPATGEVEVTEQYLPAQFNTASTLEKDVPAGSTEMNFDLTE